MDIKDSYLHGTVGVVKSISVAADKLSYKLADVAGTTKTVTLPLATQSANGLLSKEDKTKLDNMVATKVANDLILKINSGTTEGTSQYTYNGSAKKTLDIKNGTGIGFTNNAGSLQIYNSGVRSIATGTTNGTISVNTNGTSANVAIKGLGSAAYTASTNYAVRKALSDEDLNDVITPGFYNADGGNIVTNKPSAVTHFGLEVIHGAGGSYYVQILYQNSYSNKVWRRHCQNGTWSDWTLDKLTDTTYSVVSSSANGLAPKVISTNTATIESAYYVLASTNGSATPSWYKLPATAFANDDTKVTQTNTTGSALYRVLLSGRDNDTTETTNARKSSKLLFNPSTGNLINKGDITIDCTGESDKFLNFTTTTTHSWRLGHLASGNGNANYFVIQSSKDTENTWTDVLRLGLINLEATFASTVIAPTFQGNLDGTYINKLTGYSKTTSAADLAATDTLNVALGKLEYKADTVYDWYKSVTGTDNDDIINKWEEIVDFIDSVKEGADITDEFVTRKTALTITGLKTFTNKITIKTTSANKTPKVVFDEYYNSSNPSWISEIASDYYGTNICETTGFTHGFYITLGRSGFDNLIILNSSKNPIARISKNLGHWFDGDTTIQGSLNVNGTVQAIDKLTLLSSDGIYDGVIQLREGNLEITSTKISVNYTNLILAKHGGNVIIGNGVNTNYKLNVVGNIHANNFMATTTSDAYIMILLGDTNNRNLRVHTASGVTGVSGRMAALSLYEGLDCYGSIGVTTTGPVWILGVSTRYELLHSGNYTSYLPYLNSASTHATNSSVIYAPTTAGTKNLVLISNGSGAPVWTNQGNIAAGSASKLTISDIRNTTPAPNHLADKSVTAWFNNSDRPSTADTWYSGITVAGWSDDYRVWLLSSNSGNGTADEGLFFRGGKSSTWSSWKQIAFTDGTVATANNGIFYIEGTGTTAGTWLGSHAGIASYYKGLTVAYKIPIAGASTTTLNINSLGAVTCYISTVKLTTHYGVGSVVILVYDGTYFRTADYDYSTTKVRQYVTDSGNTEYPLIFRYSVSTTTTYLTDYLRYASAITVNPSTSTITATNFKGKLIGQVVGTNNCSTKNNALLVNGSGRSDTSPQGDTWIFGDLAASADWGIKHELGSDYIAFYGSNTRTSYIDLRHGYMSATKFIGTLQGNADSASKLTTVSKTAWGLTYWTSGGVPTSISGSMTGVGNITIDSNNVDRFITFKHNATPTLSWRIGYLGTGEGDANYLVIQSSQSSGTWVNAIRLGNSTLDAAFGGNVYPLVTNTKTLGTSSLKWKNVYATTFTGNLSGNATTATTANTLKATTIVSAKTFSLVNTAWTDTGYTFENLASGTYAVQITFGTTLVASGIMSVYKNLADTAGDEIPLHVYSTETWRPYLRTYNNKLLISSNDTTSTARTVTIKIALIL